MTSVFIRLCLNYPLANSVAAKIVKFLIVVFSKSVCLLNVSIAVILVQVPNKGIEIGKS